MPQRWRKHISRGNRIVGKTLKANETVDYPSGPDVPRFDNLKNLAYAGIFVVAGIAGSVNGFATMWVSPSAPDEMWNFVARLILFVELVILSIRWIIATHHELDLWVLWLENPFTRQEIYAAIFGLSVFLGLLLAFPH